MLEASAMGRITRQVSTGKRWPIAGSSDMWGGLAIRIAAVAERFIKTLKVEGAYLMAYERFEESTPTFAASSRRSKTQPACTRRWPISANSSSRSTTLGSRSKPLPHLVHRQGRTPSGGVAYDRRIWGVKKRLRKGHNTRTPKIWIIENQKLQRTGTRR